MNDTQTRPPCRRRLFQALGLALAAALAPAVAGAQAAYPSKPIRFIVPYPPGGGTDIVARLVAQKMAASMGQQVVVDNKPGASTVIGTDLMAKAPPDGHTIGLVTDSHTINPTFFPKLPYDSVNDFAPVSQLVFVPLVMVAHPSLGVKTVPELIALAKQRPGKINYASIGNGTPHQLSMEWFKSLSGTFMTHIPYKGVAPALADLVAGQVDVMFTGTSSAAPYARQGRLVPLAVSSAKRQPAFPDTPAVAETPGLGEFDFMTWYGVVAPAGTPRDIVLRLQREIAAALGQPDVKERLAALGVVGAPSMPEEFAAFMRKEAASLARLVRQTGVKPD
ncbi:tripartite tricarboxylate transporter substrate binding protein [Ramlibacter sp. MAHUQ-53]|uniref:tripartite tricarboxylate transporter substrate binding protein n=1 Tax=unclassified Ramlibacter TaxID=2617605 RepID=UPI00362F459F